MLPPCTAAAAAALRMAAVAEGKDGEHGTAAVSDKEGEGKGIGQLPMMRQDSTQAVLEAGDKVEERASKSASR